MKKKICFVLLDAYLFDKKNNANTVGGAELNFYFLAKSFADKKDKYDITFIVGDFGQRDVEYYDNIRVVKFRYFKPGLKHPMVKVIRNLNIYYQLINVNADIYINTTFGDMLHYITNITRLIPSKKTIFRAANDGDIDISLWGANTQKSNVRYCKALKRVDKLVVQSDTQKRLLLDIHKRDAVLIRNGLPINYYKKVEKQEYILWIARDAQQKRPHLFLELAKKMKNEKFLMIMPPNIEGQTDEEEYLKGYEEFKEKAKEVTNLTFIEFVPFEEVQNYYNNAKLFVNTSSLEGFPNSFIQACIGRTPILSFIVDPDNIIKRYELGFVCNDDINKAVKFIEGLSSEKAKKVGNRCFEYVNNNHSLENTFKAYERIVDEL